MDKTAVVILNYNGVDYLKRFLPSVVEYSQGCQLVVIDNHSQDQSAAFVKDQFPEIQLVILEENYGYSGGYNRGLQFVEAEYYILLNSDVEVTPEWADRLIEYMDAHDQVAICQPKILSLQKQNQFDYAGAAGGYLDILGYPFCRGRIFDHLEKDRGQYNDDRLVFWAGGACFFIRSAVFHKLQGFDEDFFAHMEEIDLCWRSQRAGFRIAYVGTSKVFHLGGGTLKETNPLKTYLNFRNGLQILLKNSPLVDVLWKIPLRMVLDVVAAIRFLIKGSGKHFWAVFRAEFMFLATLPKTWAKRSNINGRNTPKLYSRLVVWEYFVKDKRTFETLDKLD